MTALVTVTAARIDLYASAIWTYHNASPSLLGEERLASMLVNEVIGERNKGIEL